MSLSYEQPNHSICTWTHTPRQYFRKIINLWASFFPSLSNSEVRHRFSCDPLSPVLIQCPGHSAHCSKLELMSPLSLLHHTISYDTVNDMYWWILLLILEYSNLCQLCYFHSQVLESSIQTFFKPWKACASSCKLKILEVGALQELYSQSSNSISQWIFHLCIPVSLLVIGYFPSQSRYHPFYTVQEKRQETCFPYPREGWLYVSRTHNRN